MKRLIFLAPTSQQVQGLIGSFSDMEIARDEVHLIAHDPARVKQMHLQQASELETTDLENDMDWGMVAGGGFGLAAGLMASTVLGPMGLLSTTSTVAVGSALGVGLGGWLGKLVGETTPLHLLAKYKHALEQGCFLVMVDVPQERMSEIHKVIRHHCPMALVEIVHLHRDYRQAA